MLLVLKLTNMSWMFVLKLKVNIFLQIIFSNHPLKSSEQQDWSYMYSFYLSLAILCPLNCIRVQWLVFSTLFFFKCKFQLCHLQIANEPKNEVWKYFLWTCVLQGIGTNLKLVFHWYRFFLFRFPVLLVLEWWAEFQFISVGFAPGVWGTQHNL